MTTCLPAPSPSAFTDVEGSTKLLKELSAEHLADALAEHRRGLRRQRDECNSGVGACAGNELQRSGDVTPSQGGAVASMSEPQSGAASDREAGQPIRRDNPSRRIGSELRRGRLSTTVVGRALSTTISRCTSREPRTFRDQTTRGGYETGTSA